MINALLDGEAITFSRFELPPDHPQAAPHGGNPTDTLELGARSNAPLVVRFELTFLALNGGPNEQA